MKTVYRLLIIFVAIALAIFGLKRCFYLIGHSDKDFNTVYSSKYKKLTIIFVVLYLTIQIFVPIRRFFIYPHTNHPAWNYEGVRWAWHLKLNTKLTKINIFVTDPHTRQTFLVNYQQILTPYQLWFDNMPDMLVQFAHYLKEDFQKIGIKDPIVNIDCVASLNGRPFQRYIDPIVNLAEIEYPLFSHAQWVVPLEDTRTWRDGFKNLQSYIQHFLSSKK